MLYTMLKRAPGRRRGRWGGHFPSYGTVNAEPNVAFNSIGEAALIFVNQRVPDPTNLVTSTTPFNDNSQRVTALYKWNRPRKAGCP